MKIIKGELPRKRDTHEWSEEKLFQFISFAKFFIDEEDRLNPTKETIEAAEVRAPEENFWDEFMLRMDTPSDEVVKFRMRMMNAVRAVLGWLKDNPHAITKEMEELMETSKRLNWAISPFQTKEVDNQSVVSMDKRETTDENLANQAPNVTNPSTPESQYALARKKTISLFKELVESIDRKEIRKMPIDKKLKFVESFLRTLEKGESGKNANTFIFKNVNVNNSTREELENSFIDYAQK